MSPEHQVIFDYLREIRDDLKKVGEKLENHLGYHAGVKEQKEQTEMKTSWVRDVTSLLKDRPWITVGIVIVLVVLGSDNAIDVKSYFEAWINAQ